LEKRRLPIYLINLFTEKKRKIAFKIFLSVHLDRRPKIHRTNGKIIVVKDRGRSGEFNLKTLGVVWVAVRACGARLATSGTSPADARALTPFR